MGADGVRCAFQRHSRGSDVSLIEGNRGLFDGLDIAGTHSTAELAKLLDAPVILVQDVTKITRTAAASVLGCIRLDPQVRIAAVIINRVAGSRHEKIVRQSIESICGVPVIGALPKLPGRKLLPDRHLGLVTPEEHEQAQELPGKLADLIEKYVDVNVALSIAGSAPLPPCDDVRRSVQRKAAADQVRIAYFLDSAFTFYYHDNLDALRQAGAKLIPVSSLKNRTLPPCDGLYIGGGFPETHAAALESNVRFREAVKSAAQKGLPIYAECAGLIFLCRSIRWQGRQFDFAGVFPVDLEVMDKPQGHGYMDVRIDQPNPYFERGTRLCGHEFHYSRIASSTENIQSIYRVDRGQGALAGRDGLIYKNVLASFLHIHAAGVPPWAANFVKLAKRFQKNRK
jgi:cobyrinic acid a,c-diamide synthase